MQAWFGRYGTGSSTSYVKPYGGFEAKNNAIDSQMVCSAAGTFSNLHIKLSAAPGGSGHREMYLNINGVNSALGVTFTGSDTDKQNTASVSVNAGDVIVLKTTEGNFSAGATVSYTLEFTPTTPTESIYGGSSPGSVSSGVWTNGILTSNILWNSSVTGINVDNLISLNGSITRLDYVLSAAPGTGKSWTFTLYKNGFPTSASVTISDAATTGSWTGSISLAIGDRVYQQTSTSSSPATVSVGWGARFTATMEGYSIVTAQSMGTPSQVAVNYITPYGGNGPATYVTSETDGEFLGPLTLCCLRGFIVDVNNAPGGGKSWEIATRKNRATGLDSPIVTIRDSDTTKSDSSHSLILTSADTWSWKSIPSGSPQTTNILWAWQMGPMVPPPLTPPSVPTVKCEPNTSRMTSPSRNVGCSTGGVGSTPEYTGSSGSVAIGADPTYGEVLTGKRSIQIWAEVTHVDY